MDAGALPCASSEKRWWHSDSSSTNVTDSSSGWLRYEYLIFESVVGVTFVKGLWLLSDLLPEKGGT